MQYVTEDTQLDPATQLWICEVCEAVYDPEFGDPDGDIAPGTAFDDIPEDWVCPVCGARKKEFRLMKVGESYVDILGVNV
ncbi:rubredoxin [Rhodococcus sp. CUA-806]|jgi:rubredoxin|nr:rubredoxin [Rhodococcus sp. CUA-806]